MKTSAGVELNNYLLRWCSEKSHSTRIGFKQGAVAIGVAKDGDLLAVFAFDNYHSGRDGNPLNIECSLASISPRWVTRGILRAVFHYPFCQLKVQRVTTLIAASNARSVKFTVGLGFTIEGRVREALDGKEDLFVTGMIREESRRWLGSLLDA